MMVKRNMAVAGKGCSGVKAGIVALVFHEDLGQALMQVSLGAAQGGGSSSGWTSI